MGLILEAAAEESARSDTSNSDSDTEGVRQRRRVDADSAQEPPWVPPRRVRKRKGNFVKEREKNNTTEACC
jgi:hypothetical protein